MYYLECGSDAIFRHISSGKLVSHDRFTHSRRCLDTFILLVGCTGTLYIAQSGKKYCVTENQFMLLFPGQTHYGWKESMGDLSYYWCHFLVEGEYEVQQMESPTELLQETDISSCCILPEFGNIVAGDQTSLLFRQLLDLVQSNSYTQWLPNHAISLVALELSQEFIRNTKNTGNTTKKAEVTVAEVAEWIRANCCSGITVRKVSELFHYNSDYLSSLFRQSTGGSLQKYITNAKIAAAKQLLLNSSFSIQQISLRCGYQDEKNFMKQFRKSEEMTPTQYRNAFFHQHLNSC